MSEPAPNPKAKQKQTLLGQRPCLDDFRRFPRGGKHAIRSTVFLRQALPDALCHGCVVGIAGGLFNGVLLFGNPGRLYHRAPAEAPAPVEGVPAALVQPGATTPAPTSKIVPFNGIAVLDKIQFDRPNLKPGWEQWTFVSLVCLSIPILILIRGDA